MLIQKTIADHSGNRELCDALGKLGSDLEMGFVGIVGQMVRYRRIAKAVGCSLPSESLKILVSEHKKGLGKLIRYAPAYQANAAWDEVEMLLYLLRPSQYRHIETYLDAFFDPERVRLAREIESVQGKGEIRKLSELSEGRE